MSYLLVFDCELTGPMVTKHALVSIGAVLLHISTMKTIRHFDVLMNIPPDRGWDPRTVDEFWNNQKQLKNVREIIISGKATDPKKAIDDFVEFLHDCKKMTEDYGGMVLASNRVDIDCSWINYYLSMYDYLPLCSILGSFQRIVDTNSFHQGVAHISHEQVQEWEKNKKNKFSCSESAFQYLNIRSRPHTRYTHMAVEDAEHLAQAHAMILSRIKQIPRSFKPRLPMHQMTIDETYLEQSISAYPENWDHLYWSKPRFLPFIQPALEKAMKEQNKHHKS